MTARHQNQTGVIIAARAVAVCCAWIIIAYLQIPALVYETNHIS